MNNIISIAADFSNDKCYPTAYVVKGDTGNVFNISIHKDGANADLSDITLALITFRQGDFSASQEGTIEGSTVSFTLNPACVRIGANLGEVALYHNETLVTTALFCVAVRSSLQDEGTTIPENESPTLIEFIKQYSGGISGVTSVNGQNGDVQLNADDVGADKAGTASVLVNAKPGEKCEGKTFSIPTGETDADGNAIYEEKTAGIGTERFNIYEDASFEWNGVTRTFTPSKPIGKFISARGTGNISKGLLEDVCGADNKTGEKDIGTRQSGCANYAESYFGSQDGCGGTLTGKYGRTSGAYNVARGYACEARGRYTIADGSHGNASGRPQETFGQFNVPDDTQKYMAIGGNGTDNEHRSNAYMLDYEGNGYFAGNVKIGGTPTDDNDAATKAYVDAHSGSSKQPDWNQNDETAPDYVKNRPFYTGDPGETVLVEESTVSFAETPGTPGLYMGRLESTFEATVGETYKVYWDGTTYECACVKFNKSSTIGNLSIAGAGSDTGEPFLIVVDPGGRINIGTADTSASHTISISGYAESVVKIDEKYLPDSIIPGISSAQATANTAQATANNAQTTANNAQTTANNAQTTANNAKSEALDLAARMFGHTSVVDNAFCDDETLSITSLPACIESIGASAFSRCYKLALTSLPSGLTSIGNRAFFACSNLVLTSLPSGLTSIGESAFANCSKLALTSLPSGLTSIGEYAFADCSKLALTSLPSGLTSIGEYAFANCKKIILTSLPSGITSIGVNAFQRCTGLTSITFTGKPTTISSSAFDGCTNLTTINVPWAEGEVANAPWGATNATINYNYTEA